MIIYDNKHTRGIDIKQPTIMKGLCTIDKWNNITDTAQAIFRLRNMNNGHNINFILNDRIIEDLFQDKLNKLKNINKNDKDKIYNDYKKKNINEITTNMKNYDND